jgi:cell division protein FtsL
MAAAGQGAAARAQPAPQRRRPARAPARTRPARRAARRGGILGGVLWIGILAVLLGGVVALNVAVLGLNVRLDDLARERASLKAENAALESQLSSAASSPQVESLARKRLGLVPSDPEQTTYVQLHP